MSCHTSTWPGGHVARADADRGHADGGVHGGRRLGRNHFHQHAERPGVGQRHGVVDQPLRVVAAALDAVAAQGVFALRREADVRHDRNAGLDHGPDGFGVELAALDLDGVREALLEEADAGGHCLLRGYLVAAERQVRHHQGALGRPRDRPAQREQLVHGDGEAGFVAEDVVGGRIAHQQDLDAGLVEDLRRVLVVGGQHGEALAVGFGLLQVVGADPGHGLPGEFPTTALRGCRRAVAVGGGYFRGHAWIGTAA